MNRYNTIHALLLHLVYPVNKPSRHVIRIVTSLKDELTENADFVDLLESTILHQYTITHVNDMRYLQHGLIGLARPAILRTPLTSLALPLAQSPIVSRIPTTLQIRQFHPTPRRQDVFFVALPAIKSTLLGITRATLLFLPFVWRYRYVLQPRLRV
jgi:hypothetical protein